MFVFCDFRWQCPGKSIILLFPGKILSCCDFQLKIDVTHLERLLLTNASLSFLLRSASVFLRRTSSSSSFDPSSESKDLWLQVGQNLEELVQTERRPNLPVTLRNDHERGSETRCVPTVLTVVAQQNPFRMIGVS